MTGETRPHANYKMASVVMMAAMILANNKSLIVVNSGWATWGGQQAAAAANHAFEDICLWFLLTHTIILHFLSAQRRKQGALDLMVGN